LDAMPEPVIPDENQRYRASDLNLAVAAIILWNTVYLGRAVTELRSQGEVIGDELLAHIAPLGWEHITFNGGLRLAHRAAPTELLAIPKSTARRSWRWLSVGFGEDSAMTPTRPRPAKPPSAPPSPPGSPTDLEPSGKSCLAGHSRRSYRYVSGTGATPTSAEGPPGMDGPL
jgi:hypothetical protein